MKPSPRVDALRAMREARYEAAQRQMKAERERPGTRLGKKLINAMKEGIAIARGEVEPARVTVIEVKRRATKKAKKKAKKRKPPATPSR
jgi:hypothetical protein